MSFVLAAPFAAELESIHTSGAKSWPQRGLRLRRKGAQGTRRRKFFRRGTRLLELQRTHLERCPPAHSLLSA